MYSRHLTPQGLHAKRGHGISDIAFLIFQRSRSVCRNHDSDLPSSHLFAEPLAYLHLTASLEEGSTHMTGNGQNVSLRHLCIAIGRGRSHDWNRNLVA